MARQHTRKKVLKANFLYFRVLKIDKEKFGYLCISVICANNCILAKNYSEKNIMPSNVEI